VSLQKPLSTCQLINRVPYLRAKKIRLAAGRFFNGDKFCERDWIFKKRDYKVK
jgi:hypothetical protein